MRTLYKEMISFLQCMPRAILLTVIIIPAYLFISENKNRAKEKIRALKGQKWKLVFLFYAAWILTSAVFSREITYPFNGILNNFGLYNEEGLNSEIAINTLLFIPLTFLYIQSYHPLKPIQSAVIISAAATVFIELVQLLFWLGEFQLSDIVHNIIGGVLGGFIWCAITKLKETYTNKHLSTQENKPVRRKNKA